MKYILRNFYSNFSNYFKYLNHSQSFQKKDLRMLKATLQLYIKREKEKYVIMSTSKLFLYLS